MMFLESKPINDSTTQPAISLRSLEFDDIERLAHVNVTSYLETDRLSTRHQSCTDVNVHMSINVRRDGPIFSIKWYKRTTGVKR